MPLQVRNDELALKGRFISDTRTLVENGMLPTAVFNRFDLAAADGRHCGEYRVIYHNNTGGRPFFLIFEAQYPNPQSEHGIAGCYAVADFWQSVGQMSRQEALVALEAFFYQGLEHEGVVLPAVINFAHYPHATSQVRSNAFVDFPWQLREFKTAIDTDGKPIFVADTVKDNPFTHLFAEQSSTDTEALNTLRDHFNEDISLLIDNLLSPERRVDNPDASSIINGFHLGNSDQYNEFQSDSSGSDNTAAINNAALDAMIQGKLDAEGLAFYTPAMIRNRAEAMSCGGCHQNSTFAEVAPNVRWSNSGFFVHVSTRGVLSPALTEQFLPARKRVLEHYLQNTDKPVSAEHCEPACQLGSASSMTGLHQCAIKSDDSIICWGLNDRGQTDVPTNLIAKQVATGERHTCALKFDNTIHCWGGNDKGQNDVPNGLVAKQVVAGYKHTCVLKTDDTVQCWGLNSSRQTDVPPNLIAKQIIAGYVHTCALKTDSTVQCWGANYNGQKNVPSGLTAKRIIGGYYNVCALRLDNTVECWGYNGDN